ncbi:hypothetical protein [Halorussus sp. MSC15.2]|uniref:DUF7504 family protein n=1 Tax=Halorussus sp. MSC15.2 TaxID=2283638 RepID=UPI0013D731CF|nr:hypothetical protein [Halorussus sp. MSC15.2]NEU58139.1 hypothetical protein [Halorussus sp. MSC15.2]
MATDSSGSRDSDATAEDLADFLGLLNELKATGCTLLVVGDARPELFTRASANLFGDPAATRYRLLAATDAEARSIADRLPDPDATPRPVSETTKIVNHADAPRSITSAARSSDSAKAVIPETRVTDPRLDGLQSALVESIEEFARDAKGLRPGELRVGIDSLGTLFDHHGREVVRRCLRKVGASVRDHDAMAHYLLEDDYDSERTRALAPDVDAVIEIRSDDAATHRHDAQQRWHVPSRDLTTDWVRL